MKKLVVLLPCVVALSAWADKPAAPPTDAKAQPADIKPVDAKAPTSSSPRPAPVLVVTGFQTPESVYWDEPGDRYLVANINGQPAVKDGNGFISVLSIDGKVTADKWIVGGALGVTLHAPKGMTIDKGVLYVSDIDVVRTFDAKTGAPRGDIEVKGASFLNDIVAGPNHKVYVSDTGVDADFKSAGTDGVWVIEGKKAKPYYAAKDLGGPNGLFFSGKDLVVNCFGSAEIFQLDGKKGKRNTTTTPQGGGDGLFVATDGTIWTSSWGGSAIYKGKLGGTFEPVIQNVSGPADFAVNTKKSQLVLPRFVDNTVEIYDIK